MHGRVVNKDSALLHHFFQMAKVQRVSAIPTSAHKHRFQRIVQPPEYIA